MENEIRAVCSNCTYIFKFKCNSSTKNCAMECPACHKINQSPLWVVGEAGLKKMRKNAQLYLFVAICSLVSGVFMALTNYIAPKSGYFYGFIFLPFITTGICLQRGIPYFWIIDGKPVVVENQQQLSV